MTSTTTKLSHEFTNGLRRRSCFGALLVILVSLSTACGSVNSEDAPQHQQVDGGEGSRPVVLLSQRGGEELHVLDADTWQELGSFVFDQPVASATPTEAGPRLFMHLGENLECCTLYTLDMRSLELCQVDHPVVTSSAIGSQVYVSRGTGIDIYDSTTLRFERTIEGEGPYTLESSPDGRWLFGLSGPSLPTITVFDLLKEEAGLTRETPINIHGQDEIGFDGAWIGSEFYIYVHSGESAFLGTVSQATQSIDASNLVELKVSVPGIAAKELPRAFNVDTIAADSVLLVYQQIGEWFPGDPQDFVDGVVHGGVFVVDPVNGEIVSHLAPNVPFSQVVVSDDGMTLYGLVAGDPETARPPRLVVLSSQTGEVIFDEALEEDVWSITYAQMPKALVPTGANNVKDCFPQP